MYNFLLENDVRAQVDKRLKNLGWEFEGINKNVFLGRSKFSTAYSRKAYYLWQRVFNVGFRVIIEE